MFIDRDQQYQNSIGQLLNIIKDQDEDDTIKIGVAKTLTWTRNNEVMQYLIAALKTGNSAVRYGILQAGFEDFKDFYFEFYSANIIPFLNNLRNCCFIQKFII